MATVLCVTGGGGNDTYPLARYTVSAIIQMAPSTVVARSTSQSSVVRVISIAAGWVEKYGRVYSSNNYVSS